MLELESFIRDTISAYLDGEIDAAELNSRMPDGWDLDAAGDANATELALLATGYLAGYQSGDRTEDDLRSALRGLVTDTVEVGYAEPGLYDILYTQVATFRRDVIEVSSSPSKEFELSTA